MKSFSYYQPGPQDLTRYTTGCLDNVVWLPLEDLSIYVKYTYNNSYIGVKNRSFVRATEALTAAFSKLPEVLHRRGDEYEQTQIRKYIQSGGGLNVVGWFKACVRSELYKARRYLLGNETSQDQVSTRQDICFVNSP